MTETQSIIAELDRNARLRDQLIRAVAGMILLVKDRELVRLKLVEASERRHERH